MNDLARHNPLAKAAAPAFGWSRRSAAATAPFARGGVCLKHVPGGGDGWMDVSFQAIRRRPPAP